MNMQKKKDYIEKAEALLDNQKVKIVLYTGATILLIYLSGKIMAVLQGAIASYKGLQRTINS